MGVVGFAVAPVLRASHARRPLAAPKIGNRKLACGRRRVRVSAVVDPETAVDAAQGAVEAAVAAAAETAGSGAGGGSFSLDGALGLVALVLTVYVTVASIYLTIKSYQWDQRKKDAEARIAAGIDYMTVTDKWDPILARPEAKTLAAIGRGKKPPGEDKTSGASPDGPMNREMRRQMKKMDKKSKKKTKE